MRKCFLTGFFIVLVIGMSLMTGCTSTAFSVGVADTPAPEIVEVPVLSTPAVHVPVTTINVRQSGTVVPPPTRSAICQDLLTVSDDDVAFMNCMTGNKVYTGIFRLAHGDCTIASASRINQLIARSPKPKNPFLARARRSLMSATTYCLDPAQSASQSRTRDDLKGYSDTMSEYGDLVSSCPDKFNENISLSLIKLRGEQEETIAS
jgi:hypothetical protein